jgi:glyoxylase-like metal-dependent hydrolase (beta-lactamase superfamily II)
MLRALEIEPVVPGISLWRCYDLASKSDLYSTGLQSDDGLLLVDPIDLATDVMADLERVAGVIVTSENHVRCAAFFAERFEVPLYAEATVAAGLTGATPIQVERQFAPKLTAVPIQGAAIGEIAIYWDSDMGTIVIGDALINFEPYGFTFLPAKYCSNFKVMRKSLARLLDYSFQRMLFAHGTPILSGAKKRLEALLKAQH